MFKLNQSEIFVFIELEQNCYDLKCIEADQIISVNFTSQNRDLSDCDPVRFVPDW